VGEEEEEDANLRIELTDFDGRMAFVDLDLIIFSDPKPEPEPEPKPKPKVAARANPAPGATRSLAALWEYTEGDWKKDPILQNSLQGLINKGDAKPWREITPDYNNPIAENPYREFLARRKSMRVQLLTELNKCEFEAPKYGWEYAPVYHVKGYMAWSNSPKSDGYADFEGMKVGVECVQSKYRDADTSKIAYFPKTLGANEWNNWALRIGRSTGNEPVERQVFEAYRHSHGTSYKGVYIQNYFTARFSPIFRTYDVDLALDFAIYGSLLPSKMIKRFHPEWSDYRKLPASEPLSHRPKEYNGDRYYKTIPFIPKDYWK
jgi:hypothetical protein